MNAEFKKVVKAFSIKKRTADALVRYATENELYQSRIVDRAIELFLDKIKGNVVILI